MYAHCARLTHQIAAALVICSYLFLPQGASAEEAGEVLFVNYTTNVIFSDLGAPDVKTGDVLSVVDGSRDICRVTVLEASPAVSKLQPTDRCVDVSGVQIGMAIQPAGEDMNFSGPVPSGPPAVRAVNDVAVAAPQAAPSSVFQENLIRNMDRLEQKLEKMLTSQDDLSRKLQDALATNTDLRERHDEQARLNKQLQSEKAQLLKNSEALKAKIAHLQEAMADVTSGHQECQQQKDVCQQSVQALKNNIKTISQTIQEKINAYENP